MEHNVGVSGTGLAGGQSPVPLPLPLPQQTGRRAATKTRLSLSSKQCVSFDRYTHMSPKEGGNRGKRGTDVEESWCMSLSFIHPQQGGSRCANAVRPFIAIAAQDKMTIDNRILWPHGPFHCISTAACRILEFYEFCKFYRYYKFDGYYKFYSTNSMNLNEFYSPKKERDQKKKGKGKGKVRRYISGRIGRLTAAG